MKTLPDKMIENLKLYKMNGLIDNITENPYNDFFDVVFNNRKTIIKDDVIKGHIDNVCGFSKTTNQIVVKYLPNHYLVGLCRGYSDVSGSGATFYLYDLAGKRIRKMSKRFWGFLNNSHRIKG